MKSKQKKCQTHYEIINSDDGLTDNKDKYLVSLLVAPRLMKKYFLYLNSFKTIMSCMC